MVLRDSATSQQKMPLKSSQLHPSGGSGEEKARRNTTYSFHSYQLTKLPNETSNLKILVL